jgi:DNA/RNA endonuclease G (NUC1)
MRISEVEAVVEEQKEEVHVDNLKVAVVESIQNRVVELQKEVQVESHRDDAIELDVGIVENAQPEIVAPTPTAVERLEFATAVQQLANDLRNISPSDKEIIDKLMQSSQAVPQDAGTQTRVDMDRAGERQVQGNADLAMGELRMKAFNINEEQVGQTIQLFARQGESTPAEVRQNAADLAAALPQQLSDISQRLQEATPDEVFALRKERVDLVAQDSSYQALVKVLDVVAPVPDQNALTAADLNARAEAVRNEPRYAGSPGTAVEGVSESRTGMHLNEFNAAEIGLGMRSDYDPNLGYARWAEWDVGAQVGNFGTRPDAFTQSEPLVDIKATQASHADFTNTEAERGHIVGQQFSSGDQDIAKELMKMSNVCAMLGRGAEGVNQGAYKEVEDSIVKMRAEYPRDVIHVRVDAVIEGEPQFLVNARGKEIVVPDHFDFKITRTPADGGESIIERVKVLNRDEVEP